jgi:uncharacterized protein YycO
VSTAALDALTRNLASRGTSSCRDLKDIAFRREEIAHSLEPILCAKHRTTANASKIVNVQLALKRRELCLLKPTVEQSSVSHFVLKQGANNDSGAQHTDQERSVQRPGDCES